MLVKLTSSSPIASIQMIIYSRRYKNRSKHNMTEFCLVVIVARIFWVFVYIQKGKNTQPPDISTVTNGMGPRNSFRFLIRRKSWFRSRKYKYIFILYIYSKPLRSLRIYISSNILYLLVLNYSLTFFQWSVLLQMLRHKHLYLLQF